MIFLKFKKLILLCFALQYFNCFAQKPIVILISIDGFRHDYSDVFKLKYLNTFKKKGTYAHSLIPVFPSKTFPNHISIITGAYPEEHGIIANFFLNKKTFQFYAINDSSKLASSWYKKKPLWFNLENNNIKTASYFWPSSDVLFSKKKPSYSFAYNKQTSNEERVNQVVKWLKLNDVSRPHFISLYFSSVDSKGHEFGPLSKEVKEASEKIDDLLEKMERNIKKLNIDPNIVIVSDHGMSLVEEKNIIYLSDFCNIKLIDYIVGSGSYYNLYFRKKENIPKIFNQLKNSRYFSVYTSATIPKNLHINHKEHTGDIIISTHYPYYLKESKDKSHTPRGEHGYNPYKNKEMHGVFLAKGPNIKPNKVLKSFENIQIKSFILEIFKIKKYSQKKQLSKIIR